jgi:hypothetical protein
MSDQPTCSSCSITVEEDQLVEVVYDTETGEEVAEFFTELGLTFIRNGQHDGRALRTEVRPVQFQIPKVFDGTLEDAIAAGWEENEFGLCCPACKETAYTTAEASSSGRDLEENPLVAVAVAAKLAEARAEAEKESGE